MGNIAIIPARSGSKGLKDKNIKELNGKPLIAYTIEAAISSGCFEEVMVSTDSELYADISRRYGASVPFLRSDENASDTATSWGTVNEVLENYKRIDKKFDTFCLLQPTSPLRSGEDIKSAYALYERNSSFAVVSVCEAEHSPLWCGNLPDNGELNKFIDMSAIKQRQAYGKFYRLNGAIYIVNTARYMNDTFIYQEGSFAYVMPQEKSIDIDTELDFKIAEVIMRNFADT